MEKIGRIVLGTLSIAAMGYASKAAGEERAVPMTTDAGLAEPNAVEPVGLLYSPAAGSCTKKPLGCAYWVGGGTGHMEYGECQVVRLHGFPPSCMCSKGGRWDDCTYNP